MNKKRKINPIIMIMIVAAAAVALTLLIVYLVGWRYTELPNGNKFLGEWENGQPKSGTIKYQNDTEATLDLLNSTISYSNGDVYKC